MTAMTTVDRRLMPGVILMVMLLLMCLGQVRSTWRRRRDRLISIGMGWKT